MSIPTWEGQLPIRRYALFSDVLYGPKLVIIRGDDIGRAEKWGGFITWLGGVNPPEIRTVT